MVRVPNPELSKDKIKEVCKEYKLEAAAKVLGITTGWLHQLRKRYGLTSNKKGIKDL